MATSPIRGHSGVSGPSSRAASNPAVTKPAPHAGIGDNFVTGQRGLGDITRTDRVQISPFSTLRGMAPAAGTAQAKVLNTLEAVFTGSLPRDKAVVALGSFLSEIHHS